MDKIGTISTEDRLLVDEIIVGMCKMISSVTSRDEEKRAKASSKRHTKSLVYTGLDNVSTNTRFRPSDVRKKLPIELQGIQYADLTDILSSYTRLSKLKKTKDKNTIPRGHPHQEDGDKKSVSGSKSFYEFTDFDKDLDRVLANTEVLKEIIRTLFKSGLLMKLEKYVQLWMYYVIKNNADSDTAWDICKSVFPLSRKDSKFDEDYTAVRNTDDTELEYRAEKKAKYLIGNHSLEYYSKLFKKGAYFFKI